MAAAPPTAEASEPTTVTPIWTVARKRWGSFWICFDEPGLRIAGRGEARDMALAGGNDGQFGAGEKSRWPGSGAE